jgi:hypothetical protein
MKKIGKFSVFLTLLLFYSFNSFAEISASVDQNQIPEDESLSLKISSKNSSNDSFSPKFEAPDFEIMNQFESSQYSSVYVNGKFETKSEKSITYILRPLKIGSLKIRNITNSGDRAPDITVQVVRENAYQKSAGDSAPSLKGDQRNFFVRAEPSKIKAFKGEQVIVSFYLYRRTKANIRDVMQYPSFEGFIREDLEMPILSGRPEFEAVNLGGIPFERALLARYAIYPIKEGKLKIDGFSIRADYIPRNSATDDLMEDPFFQFFSQVTPRTGTSKSDPITIEVTNLPEDGKGGLFTGGVGDFEVSASVDQTSIKSNAPLTLKVNVRGKGNSSLIEFPRVNWPSEFKFYESQGHSKNLGQGTTEKDFEVVLVPLQTGELTIPSITFEFFNPASRSYIQKKTQPIKINVSQGEAAPTEKIRDEKDVQSEDRSQFSEQKNYGNLRLSEQQKMDAAGTFLGQPWWRWVTWFGLLMFIAFIGLVAYDHLKKKSLIHLELLKKKEKMQSDWLQLTQEAKHAPLSSVFEKVSDQIYETLDDAFGIKSRTHQLRDLVNLLTENHGLDPEQCKSLSKVLEFSEMVRFASQSLHQNDDLRFQAEQMVDTARNLCSSISSKKLES